MIAVGNKELPNFSVEFLDLGKILKFLSSDKCLGRYAYLQ